MSVIKPGDRVWVPDKVVDIYTGRLLGFIDCSLSRRKVAVDVVVPDSTALPAVARLLADSGNDLAGAAQRLVRISELAQAMFVEDGMISSRSPHYQPLVAALDDPTLPHDWETMGEIASALTEGNDGNH